MSLSVFGSVRIRRDKHTIFELYGRTKAASLILADRRSRVEHQTIASKIEFKSVVRFTTCDRSHSERRFQIAHP